MSEPTGIEIALDEDGATRRLERKLSAAQAAIREWFAAEEAFDAIGIDGFDKPPEWYAARDRCSSAVERLRGVLYE